MSSPPSPGLAASKALDSTGIVEPHAQTDRPVTLTRQVGDPARSQVQDLADRQAERRPGQQGDEAAGNADLGVPEDQCLTNPRQQIGSMERVMVARPPARREAVAVSPPEGEEPSHWNQRPFIGDYTRICEFLRADQEEDCKLLSPPCTLFSILTDTCTVYHPPESLEPVVLQARNSILQRLDFAAPPCRSAT
jgi:hypothetical protein